MATDTVIPAAYANKYVLMSTDIMRIIFVDQRQQAGRAVVTETSVAEIIMTKEHAQQLAENINYMLQGITAELQR